MNVVRIVPAAVALVVLAACGARVTVGFVDAPDGGDLDLEGGPPPPPFADDAARREASAPSPGCADKNCGDFCTPCEDDASACPPPSVFHVCSGLGQCAPEQPGCIVIQELDGAPGPASYVPCAGRACGTACVSCVIGTAGCSSPVSGVCQVDGVCAAGSADCP